MTKNSYEHPVSSPSPDNRMLDNPDRTPEADRRLLAFGDVIKNYQSEYTFVQGATVFGSTMHGAAHEKSDVDGIVYIDPVELHAQTGEMFTDDDFIDMADVVQHDILTQLKLDNHDTSAGSRNDIRVFVINDKIIDILVSHRDDITDRTDAMRSKIKQATDEYWDQYDGTPDAENLAEFVDRTKGLDVDAEIPYPQLEWAIGGLFHPTVGDPASINDLRAKVVSRIAESDNAEAMWDDVVSHIQTFEGSIHYDTPQPLFPQTITEALEQFK